VVIKDGTNRWLKKDQFNNDRWARRNKAMFELLLESGLDLSTMRFVEYGCGPYQPFANGYRGYFKNGVCCDLKLWHGCDLTINLNNSDTQLPDGDIAVLSGVLSYIDDPEAVLARLLEHHKYLLLSYKVMEDLWTPRRLLKFLLGGESQLKAKIRIIRTRVVESGMRNHLNTQELLQLISGKGHIRNIDYWSHHVLLLLKSNY